MGCWHSKSHCHEPITPCVYQPIPPQDSRGPPPYYEEFSRPYNSTSFPHRCNPSPPSYTYNPAPSAPPLYNEGFSSLPSYKYNPSAPPLYEDKCCVCARIINPTEVSRKFPCSHTYHVSCSERWYSRGSGCIMCGNYKPY